MRSVKESYAGTLSWSGNPQELKINIPNAKSHTVNAGEGPEMIKAKCFITWIRKLRH